MRWPFIRKFAWTRTIRTARDQYTKELRAYLNSSITEYQAVRNALINRSEDEPLNKFERSLLKNCLFSIGSCRADMEQYEEGDPSLHNPRESFSRNTRRSKFFVPSCLLPAQLGRMEEANASLEQAHRTRTTRQTQPC